MTPLFVRHRRAVSAATVVAAAIATVVVTACGRETASAAPSQTDQDATVLTTATLVPGQFVPPPVGPVVLTVTGKIGKTNEGPALLLDVATVRRLGVSEVTVFEPWVKQRLDFQGVWLASVVRAALVDPTATTLHLTALNSYQIDLPITDVMQGGVFLAVGTGTGAPITVDDGGPARILYVGDSSGVSLDQWIWSLSAIDVR